jgi:uncharacterized membrane protein
MCRPALISAPGEVAAVTPVSPVLERPSDRSMDAVTSPIPAVVDRKQRVVGIDVARGLAVLGMFATHVFPTLDDNSDPTISHVVAGGRAAALFALVAGVSLAFLSGGRRGVHGRERIAVSAGLFVRAVLVGAIGLALGHLGEANGIDGILPFYAVLFLLAIPLLGAPPMVLFGVAAATTALGPVLLVATADAGLPYAGSDADPTFSTLIHDPVGLLAQLFITGEYPVVVYLAYLCVGLAIGRLDLRSPSLAWVLLGAGVTLAVAARLASEVLLYATGGLARLMEHDGLAGDPSDVSTLLWEPQPSSSWWYLALPAPHSHTPIDLLHTLGSAAAVLGVALLLTRITAVSRALSPLAAAGAMSLTLYSAHLILLATGVLRDEPLLLFPAMLLAALALAWAWRKWLGQGPLEALVTRSAAAARRCVTRLMPKPRPDAARRRPRRGVQFLAPVACAGVLALTFWAGAALAGPAVTGVTDSSASDLAGPSEDDEPGGAAEQQTPPVPAPAPGPTEAPLAPVDQAARYCELSDQLSTLRDTYPDSPTAVAENGAAQLSEMPQAAPAEIRDAVTAVVDDLRAEAGVPGAIPPDEADLTQAEAAVDAYEEQNC